MMTFIVMLGGNPLHDRFGFRYWKNPGAFTELYKTGSLGRFMGFLQCLIQASFTIAGPDYVSMAAGEVNPFGPLFSPRGATDLLPTRLRTLAKSCHAPTMPSSTA